MHTISVKTPTTASSREHTVVVCADLESLVSPHDQPGLAILLVLQQLDIAGTALLPLLSVGVKLEQLGTPNRASSDCKIPSTPSAKYIHLEGLLFRLFVGLDVSLLKVNHGFKVDFGRLGCFLVLDQGIMVSISVDKERNQVDIHPSSLSHRLRPP